MQYSWTRCSYCYITVVTLFFTILYLISFLLWVILWARVIQNWITQNRLWSDEWSPRLERKFPQHTHTHTHTRLTALCPGLPRWAGTRTVKPVWILLKQETVSGSGISWAIYKYAPRSRQITMPAPHHSVFFTGWMPFLPPNQQHQSTEGKVSPTQCVKYKPWIKFCWNHR